MEPNSEGIIEKSVDVIIPSHKPDGRFRNLLDMLFKQDYPVRNVVIYNTGREYWDESIEKDFPVYRVVHIKENEFDHGGTRFLAARESDADVIIFMTQDAVPCNISLVRNLIQPLLDKKAAVSYARQVPYDNVSLIEKYTRQFNYPEKSCIKTIKSVEELGVKAFFCSNVCAAYDKQVYMKLGGFPYPVVLNEDMIFAWKVLNEGYAISYVAEAKVFHSHSYSFWKQFKRNFDIGASQADYPEIFDKYPSSGEGKRLVKGTVEYLKSQRAYLQIFKLVWVSGWKYLGYCFGKRYKKLPKGMVKRLSMNPGYWKRLP